MNSIFNNTNFITYFPNPCLNEDSDNRSKMTDIKKAYDLERRWNIRIFLLSSYHNGMLIHNPNHRMLDTAEYFCKSLASVSEDLKIAKALHEGSEFKSRNDAIMRINGRRTK